MRLRIMPKFPVNLAHQSNLLEFGDTHAMRERVVTKFERPYNLAASASAFFISGISSPFVAM